MLLSKRKDFVREVKREMCLKDIGSKIDVFSEYREWEEHKKSNSIVICLAILLRFYARGWIKAYE